MIKSAFALLLSLSLALTAHGACTAAAFELRIVHSITGGTGPFVGSAADVNGDGRSDVSVFYNDSWGVQSFLSNEDASLTPGPVYPTDSISALEIADADGDGKPDVLAGSGFDLRVFSGNGDATYVLRNTISLTAAPTGVRVADFNEDGLRDVLVVMGITGKAVVLTRTSGWNFTAGPDITIGGDGPGVPTVVDLDADGNLDVVTVNVANTIDILYGHGDGTFDPVVKITLPDLGLFARGASLVVGDFNYDGRPDLGAGQIEEGASLYVNDGGRTFHFDRRVAGSDVVTPGAGARSMALGDLNADGFADLIVSTYGGFYTLLARPAGFFDPPVFHQVPELSTGPETNWLDGFAFGTGDFRGDGRVDLIARIGLLAPIFATYPNACVPAPILGSIAPDSGPAEGGTTVTITGEHLLTTSQVLFGSTPGTIVDTTGTTVTVQTPSSAPSTVNVTVTTGGGTATLANAFRFVGATTTTVSTEPAMVVVGEPFQLVATLAPALSGGTVTFMEDATVLGTAPVVNGRASITITSSSITPRSVVANFSGSPIYFPSSGDLTFRAFLPVDVSLQSLPAVELNRPFRVTAVLNPALDGGTITFLDNGNVAGVVPVSGGTAFIDLVETQPGPHTIEARFSGLGDYASESAAITVQAASSIPTLSEFALGALVILLAAIALMRA